MSKEPTYDGDLDVNPWDRNMQIKIEQFKQDVKSNVNGLKGKGVSKLTAAGGS